MASREMARKAMILHPNDPQLTYVAGSTDPNAITRTVVWGQRKLFISDLLFMLQHCDYRTNPNPHFLMIGAYPGVHFNVLSKFMPQWHFHLYDPKFSTAKMRMNSDRHADGTDLINLYPKIFDDQAMAEWAALQNNPLKEDGVTPNPFYHNVYLVSDIRRTDFDTLAAQAFREAGITVENGLPVGEPAKIEEARAWANAELEKSVWEDMELQQRWVTTIRPNEASLKFRLPYAIDKSDVRSEQYLAGIVYFQPWSRANSTETRLVPVRDAAGNYQRTTWNRREYEDWMSHHNRVTRRLNTYRNVVDNSNNPLAAPELLTDYDSSFEAKVLDIYLEYFGASDEINTAVAIVGLSNYLTQQLHFWRISDREGPMTTLQGIRSNAGTASRGVFANYDAKVASEPSRAAGQQVHTMIAGKDSRAAGYIAEQLAMRQKTVAEGGTARAAPTPEAIARSVAARQAMSMGSTAGNVHVPPPRANPRRTSAVAGMSALNRR